MSYSRRQLYALGETFGDSATRKEVGGRIVYGGGGGNAPAPQPSTTITESGPTVSTLNRTTTDEIPQYLTNASQDLIARGQALTSRPYEAYTGARVAEFTPDMQTAFERMRNQQVAPQIGEATSLASLAGKRAMDYGMFGEGVQQYMNPYMQNVVDIERRKAQETADRESAKLSAQAIRQNAFGGSGSALQQRLLRRDTAQQLADLQAAGLSKAYESAVNQYNQGISSGLAASQQLGGLGRDQFSQEMDITKGLGTSGDVQRQREQALLDVGYGDYLAEQKYPYEQLAFQQGLVSGVPYSKTQSVSGQEISQPGKQVTQRVDPPKEQPSTTSQLIGAGTALYGASGKVEGSAKGGVVKRYAVGGIAALNQPEMASALQGMSDPEVQGTAAVPGLPGLTAQAEQERRDKLRMAAEGQQAPASMTKITSVLSQMSDAELQQYAKLNKSDPYTMALVVSEANRRKEGGMPTQEQPKVVDQQIASMALPEETGIAQLDAGNMEFAGGGIIAFSQGDEVLSTEEQLKRQRAEDRQKIQAAYESGLISMEEFGRAIADIATLPLRGVTGAYDSAVVRPMRAAGLNAGYLSPYLVPEGVDPASMTPFSDQMRSRTSGIAALETPPAGAAQGRGAGFTDPRLSQSGVDQSIAALRAAETQRKNVAETETGEKKQPGPPGIPSGLGYLTQLKTERDRQIAAQAEIDKLRAADVAIARDELSEEEKMAREFGSVRDALQKKKEAGLEKSEKDNFNTALIEAGLAMMAGQSPNALLNIAQGAQQGLKGYQGRLQSIQESRDKLDESMARLAEIREEKLSAVGLRKRELNSMERSIMTESRAAQEKIASAFAGDEIKFTKDQADKASDRAFDMWKFKQREVTGSRTDAANLRVALSGQINALQRKRDSGEGLSEDETQELAQLQREFSGLTRMLSDRLGLQGSGTVGGSSTLPAGFKLD